MTIVATNNSTDANPIACIFPSTQQPVIPFHEHHLMEEAKYLEWIIANANAQLTGQQFVHPKSQEMQAMYLLNHLVRIAAQFETLAAARAFVNNEIGRAKKFVRSTGETANSGQVQLFDELVDSFTVSDNQQRWITIGDFFEHIFPRLRPTQSGYLPSLYRQHCYTHGKLATRGSSLGIQLIQRNQENMINASGEVQQILETSMVNAENTLAPTLRHDLRNARTVPPSQVANISTNQLDRVVVNFGDAYHPWLPPTNRKEQDGLLRFQKDPDAEIAFQRELLRAEDVARLAIQQKRMESEIRMQEKRELAALKAESDERKHRTDMVMFDHKQQFRSNSSTRSQSRVRRGTEKGGTDVLSKVLVHSDWDVKNPRTWTEAVAIILDRYVEFSTFVNPTALSSLSVVIGAAIRENTLGFESLCGSDQIKPDPSHSTETNTIVKSVLLEARDQFPKATYKRDSKVACLFPSRYSSFREDCMGFIRFRSPQIDALEKDHLLHLSREEDRRLDLQAERNRNKQLTFP